MTHPRRAARAGREPRGTAGSGTPEAVRIWLLGGFRVAVGPGAVGEGRWRLRKAAGLVKLLALAPNHRMHRERVMDLLWPDLGAAAAANNLHRTLHSARRALEPRAPAAGFSRYLRIRDEHIELCPEGPLWVDAEVFEEAAATAGRARDPAAHRAAAGLYAGELLPGDRYEAWAQDRREGLRRAYLSLLVEMAGLHEERGEYEAAIGALGKAADEEPAHEGAHAGLVRLYALSGRRGEALRQYERLREDVRRGLAREPDAASRRIHEEILANRFPPTAPPEERPAEDADGRHRHNLPAARTSFVGRERETLEVKRAMAMTRLLTLTGAGGCGKTRLALEVARDLVGAYPDGVWLVELAALSEEALVPNAVTAALGVRERPGLPLTATLVDFLRSKRMLLVLDNCEHLIYACARLVDTLLSSCAHLHVLATSREPLGVTGEVNWSLPSLTVPEAGRLPPVEDLMQYEAVQLFLERARSRLPEFAPTPENVPAVVEVCRRLDGIPLAIELAAARMTALAVDQIAERLGDSLKLLTPGSRRAAARQRTLRATLAWSYELLSEPERKLFGRLSVFSGGFTLAAAEAVCAGEGIDRAEVLDLLSHLVDKSLVLVAHRGDEARYRLLETIRQYGNEKLEQSGAAPEIGRRHARFFLGLAERADRKLTGARQEAWLDRLETEYDNLRAALRWTSEVEEPEIGLRLSSALCQFCYTHGHYGEGREWLERALAKSGGSPAILRAKALTGAGLLTFLQCDYERAAALLKEGLATYRDLEDKRGVAYALQTLGSIARERGRYDRAIAFHEESLALQRELGNEEGIARSLVGLGFVAWLRRDHARAETLCAHALALYRGLEDAEGVAWSLVNLGAAAQHREDLGRAEELLGEGLALSRRAGYKEGVAWSLNQLGIVEQRRGEHERATALLRESLEVHRDLGDRWRTASVLEGLVSSARERGRLERAARILGGAEALRETIRAPLPPCERPDYERNVSALRAAMGKAAFPAARAEGWAMSPEQAVEHGLSADEPVPPAASAPRQESPSLLTRREREVALLVTRGLTNRRIAGELTISERTVTTHVGHILNKVGATSRSQVAAWVVEQRLLPEVEGPG